MKGFSYGLLKPAGEMAVTGGGPAPYRQLEHDAPAHREAGEVRLLKTLVVEPRLQRVDQGPDTRPADRALALPEPREVDADQLVVAAHLLADRPPDAQVAAQAVDRHQRRALAEAFVVQIGRQGGER